jgi:hypothetical protein
MGAAAMTLPKAVRAGRIRRPSFASHRGRRALAAAAAGLAVIVVIAVTAQAGLWFTPFLAGALAAVAGRRAGWRVRAVLPAAALVAAAGWAAPLWWSTLRGRPVGATARVLAALAGFPPHAVATVAVTLLIAVIQAIVGCWLGWALAALVTGTR